MALSATAVLKKVELVRLSRIGLIFAPLFFAIIGAQVNFTTVNLEILMLSAAVIAIAIATKLFGCGLTINLIFEKYKAAGMRVGIGMISRGEVGLIVAGVGIIIRSTNRRCIHDNCYHGSSHNYNHTNLVEAGL